MISFDQAFINDDCLPVALRIKRGGDANLSVVREWFREHRPMLTQLRHQHGALLVRGFEAVSSAQAFGAVLESLTDELMDYTGGSAPRVSVHGRVFNATALPNHFSLPLHQEMAYQDYRPDALALFCVRAPTEGGQTTLGDARRVTSELDAALRTRCKPGLRVQRALPAERVENRTRPWMDVFGTSDRDEVARIVADKRWEMEWCKDASLLLRQPMPAFRTHPSRDVTVWANQLHYHTPRGMMHWCLRDGRHDDAAHYEQLLRTAPHQLDHVYDVTGLEIGEAQAEQVCDVLVRCEVPFQWQPRDVLLLDNVLVMHGRRRFRGDRSVLVGMFREDAAIALQSDTGGARP